MSDDEPLALQSALHTMRFVLRVLERAARAGLTPKDTQRLAKQTSRLYVICSNQIARRSLDDHIRTLVEACLKTRTNRQALASLGISRRGLQLKIRQYREADAWLRDNLITEDAVVALLDPIVQVRGESVVRVAYRSVVGVLRPASVTTPEQLRADVLREVAVCCCWVGAIQGHALLGKIDE